MPPAEVSSSGGIARSPLPPRGCSRLRSRHGRRDSSNHASPGNTRAEDGLATFPGLSSSPTQGGHFYAHSSNNIPPSLSCSASLMMQSSQKSFPSKVCDLLMETTTATTRGQSKSCLTKSPTLPGNKCPKQSGVSCGCSSDTLWPRSFPRHERSLCLAALRELLPSQLSSQPVVTHFMV